MMGFGAIPAVFLKRTPYIWWTVKDGNWNDPSVWSSNASQKRFTSPGINDSVMLSHSVTVNIAGLTLRNLRISPSGTLLTDGTARTITISNTIVADGSVNLSTSNSAHNLVLNGENNYINPALFTSGTGSTVTFSRTGNQDILPLSYRNLSVSGVNFVKRLTSDLTLGGTLTTASSSILDLLNYNITVTGVTTIGVDSIIRRAITGGNSVFIGSVNSGSNGGRFEFQSTHTIELRGGMNIGRNSTSVPFINCSISVTTNNQTWANNFGNALISGDISIANGIVLTITHNALILSGLINGSNSTSTLDCRSSNLEFRNATIPMATGVFNTNQAANTVHYNKTGSQTVRIPNDGDYRNLTLSGNPSTKDIGAGGGGTVNVAGTKIINTGVTINGTVTP